MTILIFIITNLRWKQNVKEVSGLFIFSLYKVFNPYQIGHNICTYTYVIFDKADLTNFDKCQFETLQLPHPMWTTLNHRYQARVDRFHF